MAGMLPGVECARRRRFHQSGGCSDSTATSTRRSSFCLYTSNHDSHLSSTSSSMLQRSVIGKAYHEVQDDKLGAAAREAKERLDERLKSGHCKSDHKRNSSRKGAERRMLVGDVQIEVYVLKSKALKWARKLGWKASEEEECAICLEQFKVGESLMHLPCAHRFHSRCLLPWLDTNAHCPCCRMGILS